MKYIFISKTEHKLTELVKIDQLNPVVSNIFEFKMGKRAKIR